MRLQRFVVVSVVAAVITTAGTCQSPPTGSPIGPGDASPTVDLAANIAAYEAGIPLNFDTGYGIVQASAQLDSATTATTVSYPDLAHAIVRHGNLAAAEGWRYAVTGDGESLAAAKSALGGLHRAASVAATSPWTIPGQDGRAYVARWVGPTSDTTNASLGANLEYCPYSGRCAQEPAPAGGMQRWISNSSRDTYLMWFHCMTVLHDHLPDQADRDLIESDVAGVANDLIMRNFEIVDPLTGATTTEGLVIGPIRLAILSMAYRVTGDTAFHDAYINDLVTWATLGALSTTAQARYTQTFTFNLHEVAYFHLLRNETDPTRHQALRTIYKDQVRAVTRGENYTLFDLFAIDNGVDDLTSELQDDMIATLEGFGPPLRRHVQPTVPTMALDPTSVALSVSPGFYQRTNWPLPSRLWCIVEYQWERSTRNPSCPDGQDGTVVNDPARVSSGIDVLEAYWLGRYLDLIPGTA